MAQSGDLPNDESLYLAIQFSIEERGRIKFSRGVNSAPQLAQLARTGHAKTPISKGGTLLALQSCTTRRSSTIISFDDRS
jgi:hypothetical protein